MLHFIRERAQGWIAWVIVGLLIIPFALWGINQYFGGGGESTVAKVNGTEISQREFQLAFYNQRTRMQQMLGEQYDARLFEPQIRKRVLEELVNRELLLQNAENAGYRVSDSSVVATIQGIEAFRENGVFSAELYRRQVQAQGQSPAGFEHRVKQSILTTQLPLGLAGTTFVTDKELDDILRLQEQQRDVAYVTFAAKSFEDPKVATDEAITQYYEANRDRFMTPEQVSVEYIELAASDLGGKEEPTEEELHKYYEDNISQYETPEERQARHILIKIDEGADEAAVKAAKKKAEDLLARIRAGESFKELAKKYSDDPGSAETGGDLGQFGRGVMEPDFEKAAFALKVGEVSEPVLTSFGYHLIKLEKIIPAKKKPFESVKADIKERFKKEAGEKEFFDLSEKLTNLAYETPDSLSDVAERLGLKLKESPLFSRQHGTGLFADAKLRNMAFSDEVLKQGYNSEPVEVGENHVVVMRLKEHQQAAQKPLADVKSQITLQLVADKAKERAKDTGEKMLERLKNGEPLADIAKDMKASLQEAGEIRRKYTGIDRPIVSEAFRLKKPDSGIPSVGGVALASGDYVVVAVKKVIEGDPASVSPADRKSLRNRIVGQRANSVDTDLTHLLRTEAKVKITEDNL
jgi:peptidyl-prolyl cis-trans isomerase D